MNCVEEGNDESSKDCRRSRVFAGCYIDGVFRGTAIGLKPNEYGISISRASNIWATLRSASHAHQYHEKQKAANLDRRKCSFCIDHFCTRIREEPLLFSTPGFPICS